MKQDSMEASSQRTSLSNRTVQFKGPFWSFALKEVLIRVASLEEKALLPVGDFYQ
jgi:hypothetical protein